MIWLGWAAGLALAMVISMILTVAGISIGFIGGALLGFGLSMTGVLIGAAASR
jgi:hypothetical protein